MSDPKYLSPAEFVNEVENFSGAKLKRKAELLRIYEEAIKNDRLKLFEETVFTAKYVQGLLRIVKSGTQNPEVQNLESIKKDFSDNINKAVAQLKELINNADDELKSHFEKTYFKLSQVGFLNLAELLNDLEWTKMYMNDLKR